MAKPTGTIGVNRTTLTEAGSVEASFEKVNFPAAKDEIEALILDDFLQTVGKELAKHGETFIFCNPKKNKENDFDFTVETARGPAFLELMEVAPLELFGGYDKVPGTYKPYELAQIILQKILGKATRYSGSIGRPIFLLTYITHWGFYPSETLIALLRLFLRGEKHPFAAVFIYSPVERGFGDARWLYPVPPDLLEGIDPERLKDRTVINLDPLKWQVVKGGG